MRTSVVFFLLAAAVPAQSITFGVKGGVRLTSDIDPYAASLSKRYVIGPTASFALPFRFRLEFDALYRRVGDRESFGTIHTFFIEQEYGNSWEFPVLARRTFWRGLFAGAGVAPRVIGGRLHVIEYGLVPVSYQEFNAAANWQTSVGFVAAGGIEKRAGPVRIAPELRYTRWNRGMTTLGGGRGQFDVMLSIQLANGRFW
jgi:hypothetical protein